MRLVDITGQRFGRWTALSRNGSRSGNALWECVCECGNTKLVPLASLKDGSSASCGCQAIVDITGNKYHLLTVTRRIGYDSCGKTLWECVCDCGNTTKVNSNNLRRGATKSCGCLNSAANEEIARWLDECGYSFEREYCFDDLRGVRNCLPFDFAVFMADGMRLIEYQGSYHYRPKGNRRQHVLNYQKFLQTDHLKETYCKHWGIPLLKVPYYTKSWRDCIEWYLSTPYDELVTP